MGGGSANADKVEGWTLRVEVAGEGEERDERGRERGEDGASLRCEEERSRLYAGVDVIGFVLRRGEARVSARRRREGQGGTDLVGVNRVVHDGPGYAANI
jgi:hypothetical protein